MLDNALQRIDIPDWLIYLLVYTRINTYTCACGCACTRAHRVTLTDRHTHGRVCMHVYIYNLTIHITMYTFLRGWGGVNFEGRKEHRMDQGEWIERNMCVYICVYVYTFCVCYERVKRGGEKRKRWMNNRSSSKDNLRIL